MRQEQCSYDMAASVLCTLNISSPFNICLQMKGMYRIKGRFEKASKGDATPCLHKMSTLKIPKFERTKLVFWGCFLCPVRCGDVDIQMKVN